jgi:heat shock protein HslJ
MKIFGIILIALLLTKCSSTNIAHQDNIYWIHSAKVDCIGVEKRVCLQIQKGDELNINNEWNLFYSQIIGFDYQPGFIYKLNIKEDIIENPAADGSSIKYKLLEVLEKNEDTRYRIHDIYILKSINGKEPDFSSFNKQPNLEINITKMMIYGNNGCNNYAGAIKAMNRNKISFGPLRETKMMCQNMEVPMQFSQAISNIESFKKDKEGLHFINKLGVTLLTFTKAE